MEMVKIPPWSVFISRGDVVHAGAAHADHGVDTEGYIWRYHMYFVPRVYSLPDAVHLKEGFSPEFSLN